jgi:hypothetical protein
VEGLLQRAKDIDPDAPEVKQLERDLRMARVEQKQAAQRAAAVAGFVGTARAALASGDAEAALAAVRQALQLDPQAPAAKEVETLASRRLEQDTNELPTVVVPRRGEAPVPRPMVGSDAPPHPAPSQAVDGATRVRPVVRESRQTSPPDATNRLPERPPAPSQPATGVLRILSEYADTVGARLRSFFCSTLPGVASMAAESGRAAVASLSQRLSRAAPRPASVRSGGPAARSQVLTRRIAAAAAGVAAVLVLGLGLGWLLSPFGEPSPRVLPSGSVAVDAVPWARVVAIRAGDGTMIEPPNEASTPLTLSLPPGTYTISLVGPRGDAPRAVDVSVQSGEVTTLDPVAFATLSAEEYFAPLLTTQAEPGVESTGAGSAGPPGGSR